MTPTIGRIVHYWHNPGDEPVAAIVVRVWSDECVNLRLFTDGEPGATFPSEYQTSVTRCDQGDKWGWDWPARN